MDYGSSYGSPDQFAQVMSGIGIVSAVVSIAVMVLMLWIWGRIFAKAGYSGWLSLLFLVPVVNFFIIFWFAFARWPVEQRAAAAAPAYYPPQQPPGGYAYPAPAPIPPQQGYQQPYAQGGYPPPPPQQGGYPPQG